MTIGDQILRPQKLGALRKVAQSRMERSQRARPHQVYELTTHLNIRFWATVGEEPEVELGWSSGSMQVPNHKTL